MFETAFTIEWGDCDEAGIVFYPNYFYWFDCTYQRWLRQYGLSQRELRRRFQSVTPLVDVGAQFVGPARYDDELSIRAEVTEWRERRFRNRLQALGGRRARGQRLRAARLGGTHRRRRTPRRTRAARV